MKISTKGRYGLRAALYLGIFGGEGLVPLNQLADHQNLSVGYIEQIFSTLRRAGLVKSVKGAQGGYALALPPAEISVAAILTALEGDLAFSNREAEGADNDFERCIERCLWKPLDQSIAALIGQLTLQDLIDDYRRNDGAAFVFVI